MKMVIPTVLFLLFVSSLTLADDILLWNSCASDYCGYLYQTPPCGLSVKVTTLSGFTLFQQPFDLAVSNQVCTTFLGCNYCIELQNLTKSNDGSVYPCVYLKATCSGTTTSNKLGCVTTPNNLGQCLTQGCPNGCSGNGACSSTGVCQCKTGWYGADCSQQAPLFDQCITLPQYGNVCLKLETEDCAIDATVYLQSLPSLPLYNTLIAAPEFNTYFRTSSCFNFAPNCGACLNWNNFVLNSTYAGGCPFVNASCVGLPSGPWAFNCFEDTALVPACFGSCPKNCSGHGSCVNGACVCNSQYQGSTCSIPTCTSLFNCFGNGECVAPDTCDCNDGYSGNDCAAATCDAVADCSGNGKCIAPNTCRCNQNFTGSSCADIACPYTCKNGGQCSGGTCKCASGWQGDDCNTKQLTPGGDKSSSSTYVVVGVLVGLVVAGAAGAGGFFVWRWKKSQSKRSGAFTAFDDGLIQVPDSDEQ